MSRNSVPIVLAVLLGILGATSASAECWECEEVMVYNPNNGESYNTTRCSAASCCVQARFNCSDETDRCVLSGNLCLWVHKGSPLSLPEALRPQGSQEHVCSA
jgi:hypothetical protein